MKKKFYSFLFLITGLFFCCNIFGQVPQAFNYQAVIRDASGSPLQNQNISLRIGILQNSPTGQVLYSERQTKQTNPQGLINLEVGQGTVLTGSFSAINWGIASHYLKIEIDLTAGTNYTEYGSSKLLSVPYSLHAGYVSGFQIDTDELPLLLQSNPLTADDDPIFEIKNKDGIVVFGVYNEGVRINVLEDQSKGSKSGFAVGGYSRGKSDDVFEIMRLTPDSVRFYILDDPSKSSRGGFAVGGYSRSSKNLGQDFLQISPDSVRININNEAAKGSRGGFAVGGYTNNKAGTSNFILLNPDNYFIGHESGFQTTTGIYNAFYGYQAGYSNTEGSENLFLGRNSGYSNTVGHANVFIGDNSGRSNVDGIWNVFIGRNSGFSNTTGQANFFGGDYTGYSNTSGNSNVFIGDFSGGLNTSGSRNIFLGAFSGQSNAIGESNIFIGQESGLNNSSGSNNVFVGPYSGYFNINGIRNAFYGERAGYYNSEGSFNTFIGNYSGFSNTNGVMNVALGDNAGYSNSTGDYNVFIGPNAGYYETGSNKLYISNNDSNPADALIYGEFDNEYLRFNANIGIYTEPDPIYGLSVNGNVFALGYFIPSDLKLKTNIQNVQNPLKLLTQVTGVTYDWESNHTALKSNKSKQIGFIAQDLEKVFPEIVKEDANGIKAVNYIKIIPVIVEAIKEQQTQIEQQTELIDLLKNENNLLKGELDEIRKLLRELRID